MAQALSTTVPVLHEDLADEIAMLDNEDTVFSSTVQAGGRAKATVYHRPADKRLAATLGARAEGSEVDRTKVKNHFVNRAKIPGVVQEMVSSWGVSDRARVVENPAGMDDLVADSRFRGLQNHKENKELTYLSGQVQDDNAAAHDDEGNRVTAPLMMGASAWVESDAQPGGREVPAAYRPDSNQIVSISAVTDFAEVSHLRALLRNVRIKKARTTKLTCFGSTVFCDHLATFFDVGSTASSTMPLRRFNQDQGDGMITSELTGYKSGGNTMMVVPTEMLNGVRNAVSLGTVSGSSGSTNVTVTSTAGLQSGMKVSGTDVPAGAYVASITSATVFVISAALTGNITAITVGDYDHALFLEMEYFHEVLDGLEEVDLSKDGTGSQGYVKEFVSLFCDMPAIQAKVKAA